jgi:predicted nucleic acid-binding Zn ribbon protein
MATYEYECDKGHYNIQERPMAEEQTIFSCSAPQCSANLKRIYNSPPAMFKGRGFYSTGG